MADLVWRRLGDVPTYNEPFAGSLAVLLGRPHAPRVETVNDLDCYLANFWRAVQHDPDEVAYWADSPVNEADLHARHLWLVATARSRAERVKLDPQYFDAQVAGWWVWGACLWIGTGWCQSQAAAQSTQKPTSPQGTTGVHSRRWQGGGQAGAGSGVHAKRLSQQLPSLRMDQGVNAKLHRDDEATGLTEGLYVYMRELAERLRRVRVCCGDWKRILTPSVTTYIGLTGVFLDPPYDQDERAICYAEDHDISEDVKAWAIANGDNPDFRIAYCGYDTGKAQFPDSWDCIPWRAHGGYSRTARGVANRSRERVWFSPHCLSNADLFSVEAS